MRTGSTRRDLFSSLFSLAIVASALFVTQRFVLPLLCAVILCIATWPLYLRVLRACRGHTIAAAAAAVLWAAATGVLAIIPFGAPLAFGAVALVLLLKGSTVAAICIVAWGTAVLFVADHFLRPTIIGNATALPFLAVPLGILGGVETLGLIGLFVGPVVMTLFVTLWHEEKLFGRERE